MSSWLRSLSAEVGSRARGRTRYALTRSSVCETRDHFFCPSSFLLQRKFTLPLPVYRSPSLLSISLELWNFTTFIKPFLLILRQTDMNVFRGQEEAHLAEIAMLRTVRTCQALQDVRYVIHTITFFAFSCPENSAFFLKFFPKKSAKFRGITVSFSIF